MSARLRFLLDDCRDLRNAVRRLINAKPSDDALRRTGGLVRLSALQFVGQSRQNGWG